MLSTTILATLGLATLTTTSPVEISRRQSPTISASSLIQIAPETASCAGGDFADECRDAHTAAPYIGISFANYNITSFGAQAALVAIMLFESGNFKYDKNHFPAPGTPGQGTRNMQSPAFNDKYATWIATQCSNCGIKMPDVEKAKVEGPGAVLALVECDLWSFGSAAWFLRTQCDPSIEDGLGSGELAGWEAYIEKCVGTTLTDERTAGWNKVMALQHW